MPGRTMFRSAMMLTGVNLLLRMVSTAFQVFLSGRIGAAGIGLLQLVLSVGALSMTAGMAGIRTGAMYLTAEELGKKRPGNVTWILSGCFLYSILCSGIIAAALYIGAPTLAQHWIGDIRTIPAIRQYAAFLPVCCLSGVMVGYFTAANRIGILAAVEVAEQLISMAITMVFLTFWAGHNSARACQAVIFGSGISACFTLLCLIILRWREGAVTGKRIPVARRLVKIAAPLGLADDLKAGISTTENLMVPKRLALFPSVADPLAAFGIVCGMVFPILMFPAAVLFGLNELLIPELARCNAAGSHRRIAYLVKRSFKVALLYGCFFCGAEFLLADFLCMRLYGNPEAGQQLKLYCLLIPMLYCDAVTDAMTKGLGQQAACVRYNIFTSAMDVTLLFILLPKYGMVGYFLSFFITHLINFALSLRRLLKIAGKVVSLKTALLTVVGTAAVLWFAAGFHQYALGCIAFAALLPCVLYLLGILEKEDIIWFRNLASKK